MLVRHERGLRVLALFEAAKGGLVLVVGLGLLSLIHKDAEDMAARIIWHLHLDPASHYPRVFIEAASKLDDGRLWMFASFAFLYAMFRFVEAYGLWMVRRWAEWIALLSGGMYLPLEVYELFQRVTWTRISALIINIGVVIYLIAVLLGQRQAHLSSPPGEREKI